MIMYPKPSPSEKLSPGQSGRISITRLRLLRRAGEDDDEDEEEEEVNFANGEHIPLAQS